MTFVRGQRFFKASHTDAKRRLSVWLSPVSPPALNLAALIRRYVRPFAKHDANHALQYVACMCLSADQGDGIGKEQIEFAWSEVRKIVVLAEGAGWDELVGGLRPDGTRFVSSYPSYSAHPPYGVHWFVPAGRLY